MDLTRVDENGQHSLSPELAKVLAKIADQDQTEAKTADMGQRGGILGGFTGLEIFGVPVGEALVGGTTAVLAAEVIDGFTGGQDPLMRGVIKLVAAKPIMDILSRFIGSSGAQAAALFLAYDAATNILPIDDLINRVLGFLTPNGNAGQLRAGQRQIATPFPVDPNGSALDRALAMAR